MLPKNWDAKKQINESGIASHDLFAFMNRNSRDTIELVCIALDGMHEFDYDGSIENAFCDHEDVCGAAHLAYSLCDGDPLMFYICFGTALYELGYLDYPVA